MNKFSKNKRYLFAGYLLLIGRVVFFIGIMLMILSVYFGAESVNHENSVTPSPFFFRSSLLVLLVWGALIISSVILTFNLACDNCGAKLCKVPHGYVGPIKRNFIVSFFYPDDMCEKRIKCFNCSAEYEL